MSIDSSWSDLLSDSMAGEEPGFGLTQTAGFDGDLDDYGAGWTDFSFVETWARYGPDFTSDHTIAGDPDSERDWWNYQGCENSCAIVAQQGMLESITGEDLSGDALVDLAESEGWYDPNVGTYPEDIGKILEHFGVPCERRNDCDFADIYQALANGEKVLVGLNAHEIWDPMENPDGTPVQQEIGGHAVWVTGMVEDDGEIFVVMNDSGTIGGYENKVELKHFLNAWDDMNNFAVVTEIHSQSAIA